MKLPRIYKSLVGRLVSIRPLLRYQMVLTILLGALLSSSFVDAAIRSAMLRGRPRIPNISVPERSVTDPNGIALPPLTTVYYFDQLIDHNNPSHGTFQQRYWMDWEFYRSGIFLSLFRRKRCYL